MRGKNVKKGEGEGRGTGGLELREVRINNGITFAIKDEF